MATFNYNSVTEGRLNYENSRMYVGIGWSQADRPSMQDAFSVLLNSEEDSSVDFLSVYDGHGSDGCFVAAFVAENLHAVVMNHRKKNSMADAIEQGFYRVDYLLREKITEAQDDSLSLKESEYRNSKGDGGSTAAAIWLSKNKIYCAHVGDSRIILSRRGQAVVLTRDHKPDSKEEYERIINAGGSVVNGRVNGLLGVSRAFANFAFKDVKRPSSEQLVTVKPAQSQHVIRKGDFVVLASDGVWDAMSNQSVVDFIRYKLKNMVPVQTICAELLQECLSPFNLFQTLGGRDNMTIILALFK